jgi:hypothetical protein
MARPSTTGYAQASAPAVLEPAYAGRVPHPLARLRARDWRTERTGRAAVVVMLVAAAILVVAAAAQPSALVPPAKGGFPVWMVGPFHGLASWLPDAGMFNSVLFSALMAAMFGCYLVAVACVRQLPFRFVVGAIAALHVVFLLGPPLPLTDAFNYLDYARLGAVHGINPYVHPPAAWPTDPAYGFATWHHLVSPYGPLFTLFSYALVPLGVPVGFWVLKVATAAASLGVLTLVWRLARRLERPPLAAVAFVGLNPLVLVYGLGGVHNDFFMVLLLLAGVTAVTSSHAGRAGASMVGAMAVKVSAGLALPFALVGVRPARRTGFVAGAVAAGAAAAALSAAAFGFHGPGLDAQTTLVTPLSPPNLLGLALGQGGATTIVQVAVKLALIGVVAVLLRDTWRGRRDWVTAAGWASLALVASLTWEMPWYVLWAIPFAALGTSLRLRRATLWMGAFLLISLAPLTGYVLDVSHLDPGATGAGKQQIDAIHRYIR